MIQIETDGQFRVILPILIPSTVSTQYPPNFVSQKILIKDFLIQKRNQMFIILDEMFVKS